MHISQSLKNLIGDVPDGRFWEKLGSMFDHLVQVFFHVLKHKEQFVCLSTDLDKTHNVGMFQSHEGLEGYTRTE